MAVDRRGGSYYADPAVFGFAHGGVGGGVYNSRVRHGQLFLKLSARDRADGSAGGNDHLDVVFKQEMSVLKCVFFNGVAASGAVGDPTRVAEVYDFFVREDVQKLLYGAEPAESRVKNADRVCR